MSGTARNLLEWASVPLIHMCTMQPSHFTICMKAVTTLQNALHNVVHALHEDTLSLFNYDCPGNEPTPESNLNKQSFAARDMRILMSGTAGILLECVNAPLIGMRAMQRPLFPPSTIALYNVYQSCCNTANAL